MIEIHCADATKFMQAIAPNSVDCIITDPAYSSLEKHRAKGTTTRLKQSTASSNAWFPVVDNEYFSAFFAACHAALKPGGHFYFFCDPETSYVVLPDAIDVGFLWGNRLIWDKLAIGMGYHYRRQYEDILFLKKHGPRRGLASMSISDVLRVRRIKSKDAYPTEKPVELLNILIGQSTEPEQLIVDPFVGSGATAEAAVTSSRRFLGCDIEPRAVALANARLDKFRSDKVAE